MFLQSVFTEQSISYTPSTQGAILSISFSLDFQTSDPFDTLLFEVSDSSGGSFAGFISITGDGTFQTITSDVLTNADFPGRNFSGSDPLSFGFGFTSSADVFNLPVTYNVIVDNFVVTATVVPEPSSLALSVLAAGFLLFSWRKARIS